jgi:hypothetical protein
MANLLNMYCAELDQAIIASRQIFCPYPSVLFGKFHFWSNNDSAECQPVVHSKHTAVEAKLNNQNNIKIWCFCNLSFKNASCPFLFAVHILEFYDLDRNQFGGRILWELLHWLC